MINFLIRQTTNMSLSPKQNLLLEATRVLDAVRNKEGGVILEKIASAPEVGKIWKGNQCDVYTATVHVKKNNYIITVMCNGQSEGYVAPETRALTDFDSPEMKDTMITIFGEKCFISVGLGLAELSPKKNKTEECCEQLEQSVIY